MILASDLLRIIVKIVLQDIFYKMGKDVLLYAKIQHIKMFKLKLAIHVLITVIHVKHNLICAHHALVITIYMLHNVICYVLKLDIGLMYKLICVKFAIMHAPNVQVEHNMNAKFVKRALLMA